MQDVGGSGWLGGRSIRGEEGGLVMRKEGGWVGTDVEVVFRETEVLG